MEKCKKTVRPLLVTLSVLISMVFVTGSDADVASNSSSAAQNAAIAELLAKSKQQRTQLRATKLVSAVPNAAAISTRKQPEKDQSQLNQFGSTANSRTAFTRVLKNLMPLSPVQIKTLRKMFDTSRRAAAASAGTPPKSTSTTILVNLSPGSSPPVIRLRSGFISSLIFLDSTGQPWPIQAYDNGNPQAFNIQWDQTNNPSTLLVQSSGGYKTGNFAVLLKGNPTPIMLTMVPGQKAVDYRVDLRVPGLGPNASMTMGSLPSTATPQLLDVLNGVSPGDSKRLQVKGGDAEAWSLNGRLYLRTRLTVLSPSWISTMSSPDGTHAYELMKAPVILASSQGRMVHLTIEGL